MNTGGFDVGSIVGHLVLDKEQWRQAVTSVQQDLANLKASVRLKSDEIQAAGRVLAGFGASATAAFGLLIKSTADAGDEINDLSKRTGISTELLSGYKLAADESGTSLQGLAVGAKMLANNMQAANTQGGAQKKLFDSLGIAYADNEKKLRPLDQVMLEVADRFAKMPDGAEKSALAVDLFGKAGADLIPMLNLGRAGLEELYKKAEKMGLVFSKDAAEGADEFNDSLTELQGSIKGVGNEIGKTLLPILKPLIDRITNTIVLFREFAKDQPALASQLTLTAGALGVVSGVLGAVCIMLPSFLKGWAVILPILVAAAPAIVTIGTALAAWNLGRYIGEVTGLDETYQYLFDTLFRGLGIIKETNIELGQGHAAAQQIQVEGLAQAAKLAGHEFKTWHEAMGFLRETFAKTGTVGNAVLDEWLKRLPPVKAGLNGVAGAVQDIFEEFKLPTKLALEDELKKTEGALTVLMISLDKTPGAVKILEDKIKELKGQLYGIPDAIDPAKVAEKFADLKALFNDVKNAWAKNIDDIITEWAKLDSLKMPDLYEMDPSEAFQGWTDAAEEAQRDSSAAINGLLAGVVDMSGTLSAAAQKSLDDVKAQQTLYTQVFADIINGFTSIMDGSKTMGEAFRGIVTGMIADLGKLVIAEIIAAKKGIVAAQMQGVAHAIAGIFKSFPWFVAIPLAAGAFAVVSKLFSKLLKFDKGGVFTEPTIAEVGHGTEYVLPEKKLINIVRDAMASSAGATGAGAFSPQLAFAGAGPAAQGALAPTIHITQNVSFRNLDGRTVNDARDLIFDAVESKISQMRWRSLKHA